MTTHILGDYRIACDYRESEDCRRQVVIHRASSKEEAEERASNLGWHIGMGSASCPTCEEWFSAKDRGSG